MRKAVATLLFLLVVLAVAGGLLLVERDAPVAANILDLAATPQPPLGPTNYWGRPAPQPDWRHGDTVDRAASASFRRQWLPGLQTCAGEPPGNARRAPRGALYGVDYWDVPDPAAVPGAAPLRGASHLAAPHLAAARGESEPYAFAVRLAERGGTVTVTIDDFAGPPGLIAREQVSLRVMQAWRARVHPRGRDDTTSLRPMALLAPARDSWPVAAGCTTVFVLDIHVPATAAPGTYRAYAHVRIDGAPIADIPLTLDVAPFELLANNFHVGAFGTTYDQWAGGFTGYYPEMIEMDARYGFDLAGAFFNKGNELPFRRTTDGRLEVDESDARFARFDATLQRLREHGMGDVVFWNWGATGNVRQFDDVLRGAGIGGGIASAAGKQGFADMLRAIKLAEGAHGWPEIVVNPFDEALKDQAAVRELIAAVPLVQAASPATRLYMTEWRPGYTRHYQSSGQQLVGRGRPRAAARAALVASGERPRLNFQVIGSNTLDAEGRAIQDLLGGEYWHYTGATTLSAASRFAFGFRPWIRRSEAVLLWANYKGELDGSGWTLHYVLPKDPQGRQHRDTRGPVVPSVRALAVREGIDDRRYIETLRYHAVRLGARDDLAFLARLQHRAAALLQNAGEIGGLDNVEGRLADGRMLERLRDDLRERISALLAAERAAGVSGRPGAP
ncbi:MAG: hypothetical protein AB7Q81_21790 [Gammaproteobacteria bacterium]